MQFFNSILLGLALGASTVVADANEPSYVDEGNFINSILTATNAFRQQHQVADLVWDTNLQNFANGYLDQVQCAFQHSGGPFGENLAMGYPTSGEAVHAWGDERVFYNFDAPDFSSQTGHFTQLVWKDTTAVGCARKFCNGSQWYLVCEYNPPGNFIGQFGDQVLRSA